MTTAKKIYVVEDEDSVRTLLETGLRYFGYEIHGTANPLEALEMDEKYDIYIIDLGLPWLDGFELIKKLKKKFGTIKTIVLTGNPNRLTKSKKEQIDGFLIKPCKFQTILDTIKSVEEKISEDKPEPSGKAKKPRSKSSKKKTS